MEQNKIKRHGYLAEKGHGILLKNCGLVMLMCTLIHGALAQNSCCCPPPVAGVQVTTYAAPYPEGFFHPPVITGAGGLCTGQTTVLNAGNGYSTYLWSTGATSQSIVTGNPGIYSVTVTNTEGCSLASSIVINPPPQVSVSITPSANPVTPGTLVTFSSTAINGGSSPTYQWNVNGIPVYSSASPEFSYVPLNNDVVSCTLTTAGQCNAQSNSVVMTVIPVLPVVMVQNVVVPPGPPVCFNATQTIYVAGSGTMFMIQQGGNATFVAGHSILFQPFVKAFLGSHLSAYITQNNHYCEPVLAPSMISSGETQGEPEPIEAGMESWVRLYPNPTLSDVTVEFMRPVSGGKIRIEICSMQGEKIQAKEFQGRSSCDISLAGVPPGVYALRISASTVSGTFKVIRIR